MATPPYATMTDANRPAAARSPRALPSPAHPHRQRHTCEPGFPPAPPAAMAIALALAAATSAAPPPASGEVVINEIVAATSDRLLQTGDDGVPRLGAGPTWYAPEFDDSAWKRGPGPHGFGYSNLGTDLSSSLRGNSPSLYLRTVFTVTAAQAASGAALTLAADFDDGFVAYLNGVEVARRNLGAPGAFVYVDQVAYNEHRSTGAVSIGLGAASGRLQAGENTLAVQLHNRDPGDGDLLLATTLTLSGAGGGTLVAPADNWRYFPGLVEPSGGVFDSAFLVPPAAMVDWAEPAFDDSAWRSGDGPLGYDAATHYPLGTNLVDEMRNVITSLYERQVFELTAGEAAPGGPPLELEVDFDDGFVAYLNGVEIARGNLGAPGEIIPYSATSNGGHNASMDGGGNNPAVIETVSVDRSLLRPGTNVLAAQLHNSSSGSSDLILIAELREAGAGGAVLAGPAGPWRYVIGSAEPGEVAGEEPDAEEPKFSDWIELHNTGDDPADLSGWSLSDDEGDPGNWSFPAGTVLEPGGFLLVLASGADIARAGTTFHTGFKLGAKGEYLGLYSPAGEVVDEIAPEYPPQSFFHSYGRDPGTGAWRYFGLPSPGAPNAGPAFDGITAPPVADLESGYHDGPVALGLGAEPGAVIRYTTDGSDPSETHGEIYADPLTLPPAPGGGGGDGTGLILRETWTGVEGTALSSIPLGSPPNTQDGIASFEIPANANDNYGTRVRGWLHPPATGSYTFWLATDDQGELWLSTDDDPANRVRLASVPTWAGSRDWSKFPSQQSAPVSLQAGQRYYIEALQKEGAGGDNLAVAWQGPGVPSRVVIAGRYLSPAEEVDPLQSGLGVVVRARATAPGKVPSEVVTRTLLLNQDPRLSELPTVIVSGPAERTFYAPHGVTTISGGNFNSGTWAPNDPALDYNIPTKRGRTTEREATLEVLEVGGALGVRTRFGLRVAGSNHARPRYRLNGLEDGAWLGSWQDKPSFNFFFRDYFGAARLEYPLIEGSPVTSFGNLRLRAGKNDPTNPFIKDELMRRLFTATGQPGSRGILCTLVVNGQLKGYFNLTERLREEFFQEHYNSDAGWDVRQVNEQADGDAVHFITTRNFLRSADLTQLANYRRMAELVDIDNYIDYIIANAYGATGDWPHNNYVVARERTPEGRWGFYMWDAEGGFGGFGHSNTYNSLTSDLLNGSRASDGHLTRLPYKAGVTSPEFRLRFADRIQKHFFNGGGMTDANIRAEYERLRDGLNPIMGALRNGSVNESFFNNWWPSRRATLFGQFRGQGLWPDTGAPVLSPHGGRLVLLNPRVTLTNPNGNGTIYYTVDGADPREEGGAIGGTAAAYSGPFELEQTAWVKARVRSLLGDWSPLNEALFTTVTTLTLTVSEIHYHPEGGGAEFIEVHNFGDEPVALGGVAFTDGVAFTFGAGTLAPGAHAVVAGDADAFAATYPGVTLAGVYAGALDNGGETLTLSDLGGEMLASVTYGDDAPWPAAADGAGYALVYTAGDPADPGSWAAGTLPGGSPGSAEPDASARRPGELVMTEVNYHPVDPADEFVEFFNRSGNPVVLSPPEPGSAWRLDGAGFTFPPLARLDPGQLGLVVADDPATFRARHAIPAAVAVFGPAGGSLSNGGERLSLVRPDPAGAAPPTLVDTVRYDDADPWPAEADGGGFSLERVDWDSYGDDPANWRAGTVPGGTPGRLGGGARFDDWAGSVFSPEERATPGTTGPGDDFDGDGRPNLLEFALGTDPRSRDRPALATAAEDGPGGRTVALTFRRRSGLEGATLGVEVSDDMANWVTDAARVVTEGTPVDHGDGTETVTVRDTLPLAGDGSSRFFRLRATLVE